MAIDYCRTLFQQVLPTPRACYCREEVWKVVKDTFQVGAFGIATPPTVGQLHLNHIWSNLVLFMLGDSFQPHRS